MLTDRECRTAQPGERDRKLFDGGGLHLLVKSTGYKSWRLKYRFGGKEKQLTFGPYPVLSLKDAREMRDQAKRDLLAGVDPGRKSQATRARRLGRTDGAYTFRQAALRWHKVQTLGWKARHAANVLRALETELFPEIGDRPLTELKPSDIRPIVEGMQDRGAVEQAHRMLQRVSRIFQLAGADERAEADPAVSLNAILRPIVKKKYPAILDLPTARRALQRFEEERHWPMTKLASRLLALTASRPGPLRMARPEEFFDLDGEDPRWIIPAEKMKLERAQAEQESFAFTIPLSRQAAATVRAALEFSGGRDFLFPSTQNAKLPISYNALGVAYRRSPGFSGRHVPHGWRSTFSTIMNERAADLDRPGDRAIIDLMLGHKPEGVEAHYNRAAYMPRRRLIAQEWADLLAEGLVSPEALLEGPRN
jgi:hypothetical protein